MSGILLLETASTVCSVALARSVDDVVLREVLRRNSHAEVITGLIAEVCEETGIGLAQLDAVAVSAGPGSYTGLRIGASTAKGICYAQDLPLIAVSTLQGIALASAAAREDPHRTLYCPMMDARRMEVYTALYDRDGRELRPPEARIMEDNPWTGLLEANRVVFTGDGVEKCMSLLAHNNAEFEIQRVPGATGLVKPAFKALNNKEFEDVAYFEPDYLKAFWSPARSS